MGRPEAPLPRLEGPVRDLAVRLRRLRQDSGGPSYRQLAKSANFSGPALARAASGQRLPSWELTKAYVQACGGDPAQWRPLWVRAKEDTARACRAQPAANGTHLPVHQLPADLCDFVGRETEYELIRRAVHTAPPAVPTGAAPRVIVIFGLAGIGKTALAVHAAHRLAGRYPDGQLFADLRGCDEHPTPPAQIATAFLAALGVSADPAADPVALLRSAMTGRRLLVLLDNAAAEWQVSPLMPGSAECAVIVTRRQVPGGLAATQALRLDVFSQKEAVELLSRVAGPRKLESSEARASLAELCGRLPLALRIAGSRLAAGPADRAGWLVARLRREEHRLRYLATGELDLSTVFAASYKHLAETTRRVFRMAGMFPGPDFTAAAVAVLAGMAAVEAECALEALNDASLVQQDRPGRYRMHDLLRLYAQQLAEEECEAAQRATAVRRLAAWYLATAEAADRIVMPARGRPAPMPHLPDFPPVPLTDQASATDWYDAEQANLICVTRAAARHGHHDIAWRLPAAMRGLLELRGHTEEWITVHRIGLEAARSGGDQEAEAWILNGLGTGYWRRETHTSAVDCYRQALAIRTQLGDDRGVAVVLNNLGSVYGVAGRYEEALDCLHKALAIREKLGNGLDKSYALNSLGHVLHVLGRCSDALPLLQEALRIRQQLGNLNGEAATLHCLGDTLADLGRHLEALACFRKALPIFRHLGNRYGEAVTLHSTGSACLTLGRRDHAARYLRHAIALYQDLGHQTETATATRELAALSS